MKYKYLKRVVLFYRWAYETLYRPIYSYWLEVWWEIRKICGQDVGMKYKAYVTEEGAILVYTHGSQDLKDELEKDKLSDRAVCIIATNDKEEFFEKMELWFYRLCDEEG